MLTTEQRRLYGRMGAHKMHALKTLKADPPFASPEIVEHFEHEADPDGVLEPWDRRRRARHLYLAEQTRRHLAASREVADATA